ncbi:MAG: formylglycine-generating enzyme family protein [Desulfobacterales bacterium]|nr:formylglycine-generating enzyme family protein [Desulfobacterales bacterium]
MKLNYWKTPFVIIFIVMLFTATPALSYVPDDLDFVPMGDERATPYTSPGQTTPSGRTYTVPSINYKMVYILPGTFMMVSPSNEPERDSDERQHEVTLTKGFYMGVTEVTQGQWKAIMGNNPSRFKGDNLPVEQVSWNDCQEFIRNLNRQEGGDKYRLPTEAEWEYACRAGTTTPFYTGNCISTDQANYNGNFPMPGCSKGRYREKTIDVASFSPNAWGLYDMHGNVWEWCQNWYGDYPSGNVTDPEGPSNGSYRVDRGGSWLNDAGDCRSADRGSSTPGFGYGSLGYRLARAQ